MDTRGADAIIRVAGAGPAGLASAITLAAFRLPASALSGTHPVAGEQAGFQDALSVSGAAVARRREHDSGRSR